MRRLPWRAALCIPLCWGAVPAQAATYLERHVQVQIDGQEFRQETSLRVRLDSVADIEEWREYPIWLNDHVELEESSARVLTATGKRVASVSRKKHLRVESTGFGLYSSAWASVIPFPPLEIGQILEITTTTVHEPYYPSHVVPITRPSQQDDLKIELRGGGETLQWRIDGDGRELDVASPELGGLDIRASQLSGVDSDESDGGQGAALLRFAWGRPNTWADVGDWYNDLVSSLPPLSEEVKAHARELCADAVSRRQCMEALSDYVKRSVRYEAVEIGVGSFVPTPDAAVIERGWGDCKDKAFLLLRLLESVGISSHLVLIHGGTDGRIDVDFPAHNQFNHCILGVPTDQAEMTSQDPINDELLFIDATSEWGSSAWLTPFVQSRPALLVKPGHSRLVRTPRQIESETRLLELAGDLTEDGSFQGTVSYTVTGQFAVPWLSDLARSGPAATEADFRNVVDVVLPAHRLEGIHWQETVDSVPTFRIEADVMMSGAVRTRATGRSVAAGGIQAFPRSSRIEESSGRLYLRHGVHQTRWTLTIPDSWCPAEPVEDVLENDLGHVKHSIAVDEQGRVVVNREALVAMSTISGEESEPLNALAIAETRALKRQVRLRCRQAVDD